MNIIAPGKHLTHIKRVCDNCPCLNNDYEQGYSCNLDFNTKLIWVHKTDYTNEVADNKEMRSHQQDFDLINASDDCRLVKIETEDGTVVTYEANPAETTPAEIKHKIYELLLLPVEELQARREEFDKLIEQLKALTWQN